VSRRPPQKGASGIVVLNFVVEPNGTVDSVEAVSSTFSDHEVDIAVVAYLRSVIFQGKEVAPKTVSNYQISIN